MKHSPLGFTTFVDCSPGEPVWNNRLPAEIRDVPERIGIESRVFAPADLTVDDLAMQVIHRLMGTLHICIDDCDGVLLSTTSPHAADIAEEVARVLHVKRDRVTGVHRSCSGFPAAVAEARRRFPDAKGHILIVAAEILSQITDFGDRMTGPLFGDRGAGTSLVRGGAHEVLFAEAEDVFDENRPIRLANRAATIDRDGNVIDTVRPCIEMPDARHLAKTAPIVMADLIERALRESGVDPRELSAVIPHQASGVVLRGLDAELVRRGFDSVEIVDRFRTSGNTASASVPSALAQFEADGRLYPGMIIASPTVGGGPEFADGLLSRGVVLFRAGEPREL